MDWSLTVRGLGTHASSEPFGQRVVQVLANRAVARAEADLGRLTRMEPFAGGAIQSNAAEETRGEQGRLGRRGAALAYRLGGFGPHRQRAAIRGDQRRMGWLERRAGLYHVDHVTPQRLSGNIHRHGSGTPRVNAS